MIMRNSVLSFLSMISIGLPSVLILWFANSSLEQNDLATFIKVWALVNTLIVGLTSPLFTYAPNLRFSFKHVVSDFDSYFFPVSFFTCSIFVLPVELIVVYFMYGVKDLLFLASLVLFTIFSISFNTKNAFLISQGSYISYFFSSIVFGLTSTLCLIFSDAFDFHSIASLFFIISFAFGVASIDKILYTIKDFSFHGMRAFVSQVQKEKSFATFLVTVFLISASTFILNGPLLFGAYIGVNSVQLLTFGAFLNIGLICYTMLNSFTSPIQTSLISVLKSSDYEQFRLIYRKSITFFCLAVVVVTLFLTATLNFFAHVYVPSVSSQSEMARLVLAAGLGFSTLTGLPRIGLMILNQYLLLLWIWLVGLASFLVCIFLPIDSFSAMVLAPTTANGLILAACYIAFKHRIGVLNKDEINKNPN
jgi:hypothetical protein